MSPLMIAAEAENDYVIDFLLNHKQKDEINFDLKDRYGFNAFMYAVDVENENIIDTLIEKSKSLDHIISGLCFASKMGELQMVKLIIEKTKIKNIDLVNETDELKKTALMYAADSGSEEIIKFLIENNADLTKENKFGQNALSYAIHNKNQKIFNLLVAKGADKNFQNNTGKTELMLACENNNIEIVEFLLTNDVDINANDQINQTALMYAVVNSNKVIVEKLLNEEKINIFKKNICNYKL